MCAPLAAVAAATSIVGTIYGTEQTARNARNQANALNQQAALQRQQIYQQKSMQADQRNRLAQEERARLKAASAESGLTGVSISDILNNVDFKDSQDLAAIDRANADELQNSNAMLQSRLNSIQQPDWLATGLQIVRTGAQGYSDANASSDYVPPYAKDKLSYDYLKFTG